MSFATDGILILRNLIDDTSSLTFTDARLQELLFISAYFVNLEVNWNSDYTIDVSAETISPEPDDPVFVMLAALKAACILANGELRTKAAISGIRIKDGMGEIETRGVFEGWKAVADIACKAYSDAKFEFELGNYQAVKAILSPFSGPNVQYGDGFYWETRDRNI
jgi:hypothetical protein